MMKGETLKRATPTPLTSPTTRPTKSPAATPTSTAVNSLFGFPA